MNLSAVSFLLGILLLSNLFLQVILFMTAVVFKEFSLLSGLGLNAILSILWPLIFIGLGLRAVYPTRKTDIGHREGFMIVVGAWFFMALFGAFPFYFTGKIPLFVDAFFESISGYTTTGASILTDIEALPKTLLLWRSITHWLGGMGIMVFTLSILPALGIGGVQMFKNEVPGPITDKLAPQIKQTASILWRLYFFITVLQIVLLHLFGMSWFDAINHAFATMATGGFSTKNASTAAYSPALQWIITIFMFIAGTNFSLHYRFVHGDYKVYYKDPEFRFYFFVVFSFSLFIAFNLLYRQLVDSQNYPGSNGVEEALRHAFFQVASIITTTGFATVDYEKWPYFAQMMLFILMFFGGMSGSTGGGMKQIRIFFLVKSSLVEIRRLIHPRGVFDVRIGKQTLASDVQKGIVNFAIIYIFLFVSSMAILSLRNIDPVTSLTAVLATLGNIGPGFGLIGPTENYSWMPADVKWLLSFLMLLGRLEIYPVLALFSLLKR